MRSGLFAVAWAVLLWATCLPPRAALAEPAEGQSAAERGAANPTTEQAPDEEAEVISVVGQRIDVDQQSNAVAVSTFGQRELENLGVSDISALQQNVPSLHIGTSGTEAVITLRGIGVNNLSLSGEQGVVVHQDGIALGRASSALNSFYDVRAINVLRGPQGTQGGKHTTGGRIEILSAPPVPAFLAKADVQLGTYARRIWEGMVNTPIYGDDLMLRVSGRYEYHEGYQRSVSPMWLAPGVYGRFTDDDRWDDADDYLVRGQLRSLLGTGTDVTLLGQHSVRGGNGTARHLLGPLGTEDPRVSERDYLGYQDIQQTLVTFKVVQDISNARVGELQARGQLGYVRTIENESHDDDLRELPANHGFAGSILYSFVEAEQLSFEASLGTVETRPVDWRIGVFWWEERIDVARFVDESGRGDDGILNHLESNVIAGFGEFDYWLSDSVKLGFGLRWSEDLKEVDSQNVGFNARRGIAPQYTRGPLQMIEEKWEALTYKALIDWQVTGRSKLTFNFTSGYKSGGFPIGQLCSIVLDCPVYRAEKVRQYELTSKNDFFDNRFRLNLTLFWTDFSPYQICYVLGTQDICADNGSAVTRGFEVEARMNPTPEFTVIATFDILDAHIDNFRLIDPSEPRQNSRIRNPLFRVPQDLSGNRLPRSPKYNLSALVRYDMPFAGGTLTPQIQYQYQSETTFRVWSASRFVQSATTLFNVRLGWSSGDERWRVTAFIDNLTDVDKGNYAEFLNSGPASATYQPPRVAGVRFDFAY
ncbi:MAG: TonB-dependent receptor [Myxococcota bacterium]|nr:TonB-dependent receptor [Myxococcota bacterium]